MSDFDYPGVDEEEKKKVPEDFPPAPAPAMAPQPMPSAPAPAPPAPDMGGIPGAEGGPSGAMESHRAPAPPPRPSMADFPVAKQPWWKRLAVGAAAFGSPEQGERAAHRVFEEPKERAAQQYEAAASGYDTQMAQGLAQQKEVRERNAEESQAGLRKAQERALEPMVMVKVPWQEEPIAMTQKGAEAFAKEHQHGVTSENVQGQKGDTAETVANINAGAKKAAAQQHPTVKVMGDRSYQYEQATDSWKDVGAAPPRAEAGTFIPIYEPGSGNFQGWVNPKSKHFVGPEEIPGAGAAGAGVTPAKPAGATQTRRDQADVIDRASTGLIGTINAHRDKIGNVEAILKSAFLNTPLADKELSGVASEIASYAALQPAMHGFKGQQALQEFKNLIGGVPKDPDALIEAIKAIQKTAHYVDPNLDKNKAKGGGGGPAASTAPPKTAEEYKARLAARQKGVQP